MWDLRMSNWCDKNNAKQDINPWSMVEIYWYKGEFVSIFKVKEWAVCNPVWHNHIVSIVW
jgi:hypothetical protein